MSSPTTLATTATPATLSSPLKNNIDFYNVPIPQFDATPFVVRQWMYSGKKALIALGFVVGSNYSEKSQKRPPIIPWSSKIAEVGTIEYLISLNALGGVTILYTPREAWVSYLGNHFETIIHSIFVRKVSIFFLLSFTLLTDSDLVPSTGSERYTLHVPPC